MKRLPFLILLLCVACNRAETPRQQAAQPAAAGNTERGRQLAAQYGCNVCHAIPGVDGPQGSLGPSLAGMASRPTISMGVVPNTPDKVAVFIQDPATLNPQSSMPAMGIAPNDAQDIAAFLATLK
ncbi:MAG TPA: c-type cytochrome [Thermoanaerobaculia bacterium]|jgi:cytochrome c2